MVAFFDWNVDVVEVWLEERFEQIAFEAFDCVVDWGPPTPVFLPGEYPWTVEPGRLQSMWLQRVGH